MTRRIRSWDLREALLTSLLSAYAFVALAIVIYSGYLGYSFSASFSFQVQDGWCDPATQGLGAHCFGDFSDYDDRDFRAPWSWPAGPYSHPPLIYLWHSAFASLGQVLGNPRLGLALWLICIALAVLVPAWWSGLGRRPSDRALALLVIGVGSTPFLAAIDRGNSAAFLVPPVMLWAWAVVRDHPWWAAVAIVIAVSVRPQAIFLVLVFLVAHRFRFFVRTAVAGFLAILLGFAVYPGNRWSNFTQWVENITVYGAYANPYNSHVPNFSLARTLGLLSQAISVYTQGLKLRTEPILIPPSTLELSVLVITLLLAVTVPLLMWFRGQRLSPLGIVSIPLILLVILPSTTFAYYAVVFLVPAAMLLAGRERGGSKYVVQCDSSRLTSLTHAAFIVALCFTLVPLAVPLSLLIPKASFSDAGLFPQLVGPAWAMVLALILMSLLWPPSRADSKAMSGDAIP